MQRKKCITNIRNKKKRTKTKTWFDFQMGSRSSQRNFWEPSSHSRRLSHGLHSFTSPLAIRSCEMTERPTTPQQYRRPSSSATAYSNAAAQQPAADSVPTELLLFNNNNNNNQLQQQQQPNSLHHYQRSTSSSVSYNLSSNNHHHHNNPLLHHTKFNAISAGGRSSISKDYDSYSSYDSIDIWMKNRFIMRVFVHCDFYIEIKKKEDNIVICMCCTTQSHLINTSSSYI